MRHLALSLLIALALTLPAAAGYRGTFEEARAVRTVFEGLVQSTPGDSLPEPFRVGRMVAQEEVEVSAPDLATVLHAAKKSADRVLVRLDVDEGSFTQVAMGPDQVVGAWPTRVDKHYFAEIPFANDVGNARYDDRHLGTRLAFYLLLVRVQPAGEGRFRVTARWHEPWMMERTPASAVKDLEVVREVNTVQLSTTESVQTEGVVFEKLHPGDELFASKAPAADLVSGLQANLASVGTPDLAALFMAIEKDDLEAVRAALAANPALVNQRKEVADQYGKRQDTPLHAAAQYGRLEIARVLLEAGADRSARALYDKTPAEYAYFLAKPQLVELINNWGR